MNGKVATKGVTWSAVERISTIGIQFVLNIIIARILSPSDYGLIGMLTIFLSISQCLVDSGFTNALIQAKERSEKDYGTVFIFNLAISVTLYIVLFLCAPAISRFYNQEILTHILRVVGLTLIISALSNVQRTIYEIKIDFKTQSFITIPSALLSGAVGVVLAYSGFGVWSLVAQTLTNGMITTIFFWVLSKERFRIVFDFMSFKRLGGFGIKIMFSSLLHTAYTNIYGLCIGKIYSAKDLGFYSRADQFAVFPANTIRSIISRVSYPLLCQSQSDKTELNYVYSNFIKSSCFILFPLMIGLSVLSKPLVLFLLTEKWIFVAPLMSILALNGLTTTIIGLNLDLLVAVGRSDLFLRLEIVKKSISIGILLLTINYGLFWICVGRFIYSIIALVINMYYTVDILDKSYSRQMMDWLPNLFVSLLMGLIVAASVYYIDSPVLQLVIGSIVGVVAYYLLVSFFKIEAKDKFFNMAKRYIRH